MRFELAVIGRCCHGTMRICARFRNKAPTGQDIDECCEELGGRENTVSNVRTYDLEDHVMVLFECKERTVEDEILSEDVQELPQS